MSSPEDGREAGQAELLCQALRAIRKARRLKAPEVAAAMGLAPRTYERFESGRGGLDLDRIRRFAEATDSDPVSIVTSVMLRAPEFALRTADNKLMLVQLLALRDFNEDLGDDIALIEPRVLVGAFRRVFQDLADYLRKRDLTAETWLDVQARRMGLRFSFTPRRPTPPRGRR